MTAVADLNCTSIRPFVDVNLDDNKDDVLLSIYDILSEIKTSFPEVINKYDDISDMAELKKHSFDLLNYICKQKDRDAVYNFYPKSPAALNYDWLRMLQEVEEDVTAMRGYLCGLSGDYHVAHIRSLRNRATRILQDAKRILVVDVTTPKKSPLKHSTYKISYTPPTSNTKAAPSLMLFNDDELRFYYEGIAVPETEEERIKAKNQYKGGQRALVDEQVLSWRFKNNSGVDNPKGSTQSILSSGTMKRKRSSTEASLAVKKRR